MKKKEQKLCQKIYENNAERILWYLRRHYSWIGEENIHDVMQNTWAEMCEHITMLGEKTEAAQWAWLVTVAKSKVVSLIRMNARDEKLEEKVQGTFGEFSGFESAEEAALQRITAEGVLEKLSAKEKQLLVSEYLELPISEEKSTRSNADVCKRYRVRKKLQKYMKEGGMDE